MSRAFARIAFTDSVKEAQRRNGARHFVLLVVQESIQECGGRGGRLRRKRTFQALPRYVIPVDGHR